MRLSSNHNRIASLCCCLLLLLLLMIRLSISFGLFSIFWVQEQMHQRAANTNRRNSMTQEVKLSRIKKCQHLYYLLRPELIRQSPVPLSSDAFSAWGTIFRFSFICVVRPNTTRLTVCRTRRQAIDRRSCGYHEEANRCTAFCMCVGCSPEIDVHSVVSRK